LNDLLTTIGVPATMFVTPSVVEQRTVTITDWMADQHQIGLHIHPARLGGDSDWLETYEKSQISAFLESGIETFEEYLGEAPAGFRAGRWSFNEDVLAACGDAGIEWDASQRCPGRLDPYVDHGTWEFPMSVYSDPLVRCFLRPYGIDGVPLHVDGFIESRFRSLLLAFASKRIAASDAPYIMVSLHDYDLVDQTIRQRIQRYLTRLVSSRRVATIPNI